VKRLDDELARNAPKGWTRAVWLVIGIWLLLYGSFTLINPPLLDDADSVHAEAAREMVARGDPVTLYANGIRYLEKAPLLYWSMAASFRAFGAHTWSARLPLAIFALALFLAVYVLGRRIFGSDEAGLYAALALEMSFGIFIFTRILIPDVVVCFWMVVAMLFFWRSLEGGSGWTAAGFGAACALNVLTKGLIGVVFPVLVVLCFLLVTRNLGHLRRWHPWVGMGVFFAIAAPWHVAAGMANPTVGHPAGLVPTQGNVRGFFWFYFVNEHVLRFLNQRVPRDYDTVPLVLFWGLVLVWMLPWSLLLPAALVGKWGKERVLLAIWVLVPLIFFSFSTRQEYYVLPSLPALALLIGGYLSEVKDVTGLSRVERWTGWGVLVVGVLAGVAAIGLGLRSGVVSGDLAGVLRQNPGEYALSFGHFLDLTGNALGFFRGPLLDTGLALVVGSVGFAWYWLRCCRQRAAGFLVAGSAAFLVAAHLALETFAPVLSSAGLAAAIRPEVRPGDVVVIDGEYESGSTLGFYLRRQVGIWNGRSSNLWYGSFFPDAPDIFYDDAQMRALWAGSRRVFLWVEEGKTPALPGPVYVVARGEGKEILSNRD
jgi:4-amino-4-deoxy-L-arabinose transferase-like glycosyltransferase